MNTVYEVIGESSFIFQIGHTKILTDPWFGEAIYGGGWTQFPVPRIRQQQLENITHIFISHVHPDHCCIESIELVLRYSPDAKLLIMERSPHICFLSKKLSANFSRPLNEWVIYIQPFSKHKCGDVPIYCLPPSKENSLNFIIDSSLLLESPEGLIFFSNDNLPTAEHAEFINSLNCNQYLALLPFSGGSGYPASYYNIEESKKIQIATQIRAEYEEIAFNFLKASNFTYYMPVAGNHILTSRTYDYHKMTGFLQNPYSVLRSKNMDSEVGQGLYFEPGEIIDPLVWKNKQKSIKHEEEEFEFRRRLFIKIISSRITPLSSELSNLEECNILKAFERYKLPLQDALIDADPKSENASLILIVTCSNISLTLTKKHAKIEKIKFQEENAAFKFHVNKLHDHDSCLCIDINPKLLNAIITRQIHINEADAACLIKYYRTMPYIPELYASIFTIIN